MKKLAYLLFPFILNSSEVNIDNFTPPNAELVGLLQSITLQGLDQMPYEKCDSYSDFSCGVVGGDFYAQLYSVNFKNGEYTCLVRDRLSNQVMHKYSLKNSKCEGKDFKNEQTAALAEGIQEETKMAEEQALILSENIKKEEGEIDLATFLIAFFTLDSDVIDFQKTLSDDKITLKEGYKFAKTVKTTEGEFSDESGESMIEAIMISGAPFVDFMLRIYLYISQFIFSIFSVILLGALLHKGVEYGTNYVSSMNSEHPKFDNGQDDNLLYKMGMGVFIFLFFFASTNFSSENTESNEVEVRNNTFFTTAYREFIYHSINFANEINFHLTEALIGSNFKYLEKNSGQSVVRNGIEKNRLNDELTYLMGLEAQCIVTYDDVSLYQNATTSTDFPQNDKNPYLLDLYQSNQGDSELLDKEFKVSKNLCWEASKKITAVQKSLETVEAAIENQEDSLEFDGSGGGMKSQGEKGIKTAEIMWNNAKEFGMIAAAVNPSAKLFFQTITDTTSSENTETVASSNSLILGNLFSSLPYTMLPGFEQIKNVGCQSLHAGKDLVGMVGDMMSPASALKDAAVDAAKAAIIGKDADEEIAEATKADKKSLCSGFASTPQQAAGTVFAFFSIKTLLTYLPFFVLLVVGIIVIITNFFTLLRYMITSMFAVVWIFVRDGKQNLIHFLYEGIGIAIRFPMIVISIGIAYIAIELYQNISNLIVSQMMDSFQEINNIEFEFSWTFLATQGFDWLLSIVRTWMLYFLEGGLGIIVALASIYLSMKMMTSTSDYILDQLGFKQKGKSENDFAEEINSRVERYQNPF